MQALRESGGRRRRRDAPGRAEAGPLRAVPGGMRLLTRACALALVTASSLSLAGCGKSAPAAADGNRDLAIAVTAKGFEPKTIKAQVGKPLTLVVTRKVERTCATEIVIKDFGIDKPLPLGQAVTVELTPTKPGPIRFACAMDMIAGEIAVQ